jgi:WW domain-binding protein 4
LRDRQPHSNKMTEYWVSQSKYWCDLCKCWLNDTPSARANHERGTGHKLNVQKKLRQLRQNAEAEKKEKEKTAEQLKKIEKAAEKAYEKDLQRRVCTTRH